MKIKHLDVFLAIALLAVVVSSFAYTWTPVPAGGSSLGMSADGRVICFLPSTTHPKISTNWGQTWAVATNSPPWGTAYPGGVAISADGTKIIASLGTNSLGGQHGISISSDYGASWVQTDVPGASYANPHFVACSADATKLIVATKNGSVYFSTNTGINWLTSSVPNTNWVSVASSADGERMVGAVDGGRVYFSTNFGSTWTSNNLSTQKWASVCISSDGNSVGAVGTNSYISRDAGSHWITNKFSNASIACSANGTTWMIAGAQFCTSSDGGVTWTTNFSNANATWGGAMSADGCEIVVSQSSGSGGLTNWVGHITPSPQLKIQPADTNTTLSWLLPSTNFVLQLNSDLTTTNWVTFSNSPILNFTNIQYEVEVPSSASNSFFRLIAQ